MLLKVALVGLYKVPPMCVFFYKVFFQIVQTEKKNYYGL